jgi:prolyl oligopeptidase
VTHGGPRARRDEVVDVWHGVEVPDPYRWLEDGDAAEVAAWVRAQNDHTRALLDARPERPRWHERLVALLGAGVSTGCRLAGDAVFTLERAGGQSRFVLVVRSALDRTTPARTLIDPAQRSGDVTAAIDWFHPSQDGRLVAYGVSEGGDERSTLRVVEVESAEHREDEIPDTRAATVGWLPDGGGFLYTRYPEGDEYHRRVWGHTLGAPWQDDPLVWGDLPEPESWPDVTVSPDGHYALIHVLVGWRRMDVHLWDRISDRWATVIGDTDVLSFFEVVGDRLVGTTTLDAPRGRVVTAPCADPSPGAWTTLVPEGEGVIDGARVVGGELLVRTTVGAVARLHRYAGDGTPREAVTLPEACSFAGFDADPDRPVAVVQLESFTRPATLLRWTPDDGLVPWGGREEALDVGAFTVRHVRYSSLDGTEIGLFLVHRADRPPTPETACVLTGYGGFAIAETPAWSPAVAAWCEQGGLYAIAGLRGGYEEGQDWHHAGRRQHKQRVFDDFSAAADFLVASGWTARARLALRGGSNGGLLVAASLTQQPAMARAVHCAVPLLDMVRYPQFLVGRLWTDEYGDPDVAEEFGWLHAYSPYHHVTAGTCYPAVLFTAAEGDGRVDPMHARKMAAALQWASSCHDQRPVLLRQEGRAGHGAGKPLEKQADELADVLTFFSWQLGPP